MEYKPTRVPATRDLVDIIKNDGSLREDPERKMLYLSYAGNFIDDLSVNLDLTSIELNEKYLTENAVSWRNFLRHPSVEDYINGFKDERLEKEAMKTLSGEGAKPADALKVKDMLNKTRKKTDNSNIVVVFMPQKEYKLNELN